MKMFLQEMKNIQFPTPGVEPGHAGWKPAILAVRPRGIYRFNGTSDLICTQITDAYWNSSKLYHHFSISMCVLWILGTPRVMDDLILKWSLVLNCRGTHKFSIFIFWGIRWKILSPNVGLKPTTLRLRVSFYTDWASRVRNH